MWHPRRMAWYRRYRSDCPRLTVVHDDFDPGSAIRPNISQGWPRILSDLKTLLETGDILPVG